MDALIAIAALCQVSAGCRSMKDVDSYQLACQKELIECYEKKLPTVFNEKPLDPVQWWGPLKDCVKERKVK